MSKKQDKWFIRATTIDTANGPQHQIVTTHKSYSHAANHLSTVLGAEQSLHNKCWTKGKIQFHVLPLDQKKKSMEKTTRTEELNEFVQSVYSSRSKQQIVEDAEKRVKDKEDGKDKEKKDAKPFGGNSPGDALKKPSKARQTPKPPETGTASKTITGEKPNEIDVEPELTPLETARPVSQVSPTQQASH